METGIGWEQMRHSQRKRRATGLLHLSFGRHPLTLLQTTSYQHIDDTGARVNGVNHYFSTLCNSYYASFFTHRRKNHDTVADLLSLLEEQAEGEGTPSTVLSEDEQPHQQRTRRPTVAAGRVDADGHSTSRS